MATQNGSLKRVKVASLKKARYNPKTRQRNIAPLAASIEKHGLLYPVLVNKQMEVVDGHRRLSACESLGWEEVPVLVVEGEQSELFSECGTNVRPLLGNETLFVYIREPRAIGAHVRTRIQACEEIVGRATIRALASGGFSIATWDVARRICRLADQETPEMQSKALKWLIKHRCAGVVRHAMQQGVEIGSIVKTINADRPPKSKMTLA